MDAVETNIRFLLDGSPLNSAIDSLPDYSLDDQVKELADKGIDSHLGDYRPICQKTVTYIVAAVLFNNADEVLMMQEAKSSCAGTWYLPAGRVEPGEDLVQAVIREVLEETGLMLNPTTLIMVENSSGNWYRFVFTGTISGGNLKSVSQADSESLQAAWVSDLSILSLRSKDILQLIEKGREYWRERQSFHPSLLPSIHSHSKLLLRIVFLIKKKQNNRLHALVSLKEAPHLPITEINPTRSVHASIKRFIQNVFEHNLPPHKPHGVLTVEHSGMPANDRDGMCLTILASCKEPLEHSSPKTDYTWLELSSSLEDILMQRLKKNQTIHLNVIR